MQELISQPQTQLTYPLAKVDTENIKEVVSNTSELERVSLTCNLSKLEGVNTPEFYEFNDISRAKVFAKVIEGICTYVPEKNCWFYFDGTNWKEDIGNIYIARLAIVFSDCLLTYYCNNVLSDMPSMTKEEIKYKNKLLEFLSKNQWISVRENMIKDAKAFNFMPVSAFDSNPNLFNCLNGTLDLSDFSFHKHNPKDYCLKIANVNYDPNAKSERFEKFILEIFEDDKEKAEYIQCKFGSALTGEIHSEEMYCLYGPTTRNGKSTLVNSIGKLFGDYGAVAQAETLMQSKYATNPDGATASMAALHGKRFVAVAEPAKNVSFDVAKIKQMTGNDPITARFLHKNLFTFVPQFKIFMHANTLPNVNDATLFSSNRINIIPFTKHFKEEEMDLSLKDIFLTPEVQSAILNWLIEGLRIIKDKKWIITRPQSIVEAINDYEYRSNREMQFTEECFEIGKENKILFSYVYKAYKTWCQENGYGALGKNKLKEALVSLRFEIKNGAGNKLYLFGYRLNDECIDSVF